MPQELAPDPLPHVDLDEEPLKVSGQTIEDAFALELVNRTFGDYEQYRQTNHDPRWSGNDSLYLGYIAPRVWDGTKIPKATLSQPICFAQIEAALPVVNQALFPNGEWFQVEPEPGADPQEARAIRDHLLYLLDHDADEFGRTARRELDLAAKSALTYGNGGIIIQWDPAKRKPVVEWVDLRDLYVDPGCSTPSLDDCRSVIRRLRYSVEELDAMRKTPGMNIPPKEVLVHFSRRYRYAAADRTKSVQESYRGVNFVPGTSDYSANPGDRGIEVLVYYSKSRIIWVIGGEWVGFNAPNPYGFMPFCFAPCFTVLSRFYAQGFSDVLEGTQRYIEALYNARLNELALSINPPRVKKLGSTQTPGQDRWAPGMVSSVNNPKEDWVVQFPQQATSNLMNDIEFMMGNSQTYTGANSFIQGVPAAGNVNRTATGVSSQTQAGSSRLYYIIRNIEEYLIVPMLYKMYKLIQFHSSAEDILPALGPNNQKIQVGAGAFHQPVRFKMTAASQMLTRDKLMQILPFLSQYYLNGTFLEQLHGVGQTVDFDEFQQCLQDATGTGRMYRLIRPLNQQEQQKLSQPPMQAQMQAQTKQQELQVRKQIADDKNQTELQKVQMQKQPDHSEIQQRQAEMQMDAQDRMQERSHQAAMHQMEMQQRQEEMAMKQKEAHNDMALELLKGHMQMQQQQQQAALQNVAQVQGLHHTQENHDMALANLAENHKTALAQGSEKHKAGLTQGAEKHKAGLKQKGEAHKSGLKQKEASVAQDLELKALMAQAQMQPPQGQEPTE